MHYQIHNGSRDVQTRTVRATRPTHGGLKQYIMNGTRRLIRGRPVTVTEEELKQHIDELRAKATQGILYITLLDGREVNLWTGDLGRSVPPANMRPEPPLDDAANDKQSGIAMNQFAREPAPPKEFTMPVAPPTAAVENNPLVEEERTTVEVLTETAELAVVTDDVPPEETTLETPQAKKDDGKKSKKNR